MLILVDRDGNRGHRHDVEALECENLSMFPEQEFGGDVIIYCSLVKSIALLILCNY